MPFISRLILVIFAWAAMSAPVWAQAELTGGNGTLYIGGYASKIYVIDEATEQVVDEIEVTVGVPRQLTLSNDRTRFYMTDIAMLHVEIVDVASRESIDSFTLSEGSTTVRIRGFAADPQDRYLVLHLQPADKLIDRFEIGPHRLVQYDLATHEITREIPWPEDRERTGVSMLFSPDGSLLYFFLDDIIIYDTTDFTEVDRWELSQPIEDGMGPIRFGARDVINEEPGYFTGLFTVPSPVRDTRLMGVARVNLQEKRLDDFYTLGPSTGVGFTLAPDRQTAYGLVQQIGRWEFWTFDLENRRLGRREPFEGRPRMALQVSSNGKLLYVFQAGETIDLYEAETYRFLRTIDLEADATTNLIVVPPEGGH